MVVVVVYGVHLGVSHKHLALKSHLLKTGISGTCIPLEREHTCSRIIPVIVKFWIPRRNEIVYNHIGRQSSANMDLSSDEEEAILFLALEDEENGRKKRRKWVHEINLERQDFGEFHRLMPQLRQDKKRFFLYFRMSSENFDEILTLIKRGYYKNGHKLSFLATGDSFSTIGHSFRIGFETVSAIVTEVCQAICRRMENIYLPEPTRAIWEKSAKGFEDIWRFPNCIGSIDGKHVTIKCPNKTGSQHFCYLHKFSIVLMAIVGPDYRFICVDIGDYGKNSDGGIFENSHMGQRFEAGLMNIPEDKPLPGQSTPCSHVLIGDEAFALKPYLMRPFPYRQSKIDTRKENYNMRLCKARRVVENAFGILVQKWRIFFRPIATKTHRTNLVNKVSLDSYKVIPDEQQTWHLASENNLLIFLI
ncbi:hypothetical protein NQ318_016229 [Aromia moschata]|uniref:DDE Tnp4 domain-containing protein n=1 Tax=Aromia moschata TaxID=1265417 RepID=A0AAV8XBN0_9CUCU|nr:hypothetical protein NQ318_016229 [Aromia moschata]